MDYEKAYKEAIKRAKAMIEVAEKEEVYKSAITIFPELKESDDDRIRKGIIRNLEYLMDRAEGFVKDELKERIAWLEKQGGQKPADKVEPKFKVGDWIVTPANKVFQITSIEGTSYKFDNESHYWEICYCDEQCRLWTIQDAKDGNVLVNWNNTVFIFKAIEDETVKFHIAYNEKWDAIKTSTRLSHLGLPEPQFDFHPATKEQRNTLEKAMADAGYTFDFEKKKLKKIEQNPAWTEEDKRMLNGIIKDLVHPWNEYIPDRIEDEIKWLKNKLKSLRHQNTWKPSDEQMEALHDLNLTGNISYAGQGQVLIELYNDLKKL